MSESPIVRKRKTRGKDEVEVSRENSVADALPDVQDPTRIKRASRPGVKKTDRNDDR
jgi:hypothetical protein